MEQKEHHHHFPLPEGNGIENVQPKYFGLMLHILLASWYWWPTLTFPPVTPPPFSVSSHRSSHGQEPHSQWVQHVPFQSLQVVIFRLARRSPSCHSVTNDWSGLNCTCAALVLDWEPCLSHCLTLFFHTVWWFTTGGWLDYITVP